MGQYDIPVSNGLGSEQWGVRVRVRVRTRRERGSVRRDSLVVAVARVVSEG